MATWTKVEKISDNTVNYQGEPIYYNGIVIGYGAGNAWTKISEASGDWTTVS